MTVPQVGHLPLMALRPFFIVSSTPLAISRLALHLTQYPSGIKTFTIRASCPNGEIAYRLKSGNATRKNNMFNSLKFNFLQKISSVSFLRIKGEGKLSMQYKKILTRVYPLKSSFLITTTIHLIPCASCLTFCLTDYYVYLKAPLSTWHFMTLRMIRIFT